MAHGADIRHSIDVGGWATHQLLDRISLAGAFTVDHLPAKPWHSNERCRYHPDLGSVQNLGLAVCKLISRPLNPRPC